MVLRKDSFLIAALAITLALILAGPAHSDIKLTMSEAIRLSETHSLGVQSARFDSLVAINDYMAVRALRYPTASLNATAFYIDEVPTLELPFSTMTLGNHETYQADIRLSYPFYTGGRIANQVRAQRSISESRGASLDAKRLENAYSTRKAYLGLMSADAVAASAAASLERVKVINQNIANLYASGFADSSNLLESE